MPLVLVPEADAIAWTGRPGPTIRRWAMEGRIHRHGTGRGNVRYNLFELPCKGEAGQPGATPPLPVRTAA